MIYLLTVLELGVAAILLAGAFAVLVARRSFLLPPPISRLMRIVVAVATALPGIGMIVATLVPIVAFFAAMLAVAVAGTLAGATRLRGERPNWIALSLVVVGSLGAAILQPLGLRVLALPKADALVYQPIPAQVIKTYDAGVGFESVRAGPMGTLYLAANAGLDFTDREYYRKAQGQIIARHSDGTERIVFTTPVGSTAGVMAIASDATIYMTSNGRSPGIWRISPQGEAAKIATMPSGAWPNGLDFGPDGMLYSADSNLGLIWRIDPVSGKFDVAIRNKRLSARPFVALAPGANGLHFRGRDLIVTVSDSTEILKFSAMPNGTFGPASLIARGIPGDDFAVAKDGSLFVTTHPYNTVVRVEPNGRRTTVADARQQIVGATDICFGSGAADRDVLYVATDGGAFTAGAKARGQLIALTPYR
ncbi:SMP-30/gluconolactonase/LRE family protein [Novosphingobium aquiterrae]|uniref:SMP-30/gluconolactonase/LRE family protein n=1 Tax=Novosphingobium aquiterrae TaxID=624388 RepID=A0ABV6PHS9_9SPHN